MFRIIMKLNRLKRIGLIIGISFIGISSFINYQYNQLLYKSIKNRCGNDPTLKKSYSEYIVTVITDKDGREVFYVETK